MPWSRFEPCWEATDGDRVLTYKDAIREAIDQAMILDPRVFAMGLDADDQFGCYGSMLDLTHPERVLGTPICENAGTGAALGAALSGMRPILVHMRVDFLFVAMDQIVNYVAKWRDMHANKVAVPLVIRAVVGRGWGCGAQHSQTMHGLFSHVPGLKVVTPATPFDVKGLFLEAVKCDEPVLFLEHRWLFKNTGHVPKEMYTIPFGHGQRLHEGGDATVVASSLAAIETLRACEQHGLDVDVIDPRTIKPLDVDLILESVDRTGKLLVVDYDAPFGGFAAEVAALVAERRGASVSIRRLSFPDRAMPASGVLERRYYPDADRIAAAVRELTGTTLTPELLV